MAKAKIGLALGGGAARGWAHIGVLKALAEAGIKPDIIAGTSIGAVVGACHAAGHLDALEEFARELTRRRIFGYLDFNFAGTALINGQRLCDRLERQLGELHIEEVDPRFTAVATELGTGHEIWLSRGRLADAVRASYALPGIFRPVKINGRWLIDGALVNPIPVSVCRALGARIVIAVTLNNGVVSKSVVIHDQEAFADPPMPAEDMELPGANGRAAIQLLHRQIFGRGNGAPGISAVMMDAINITQDRIARSRLAGDPPDITISPRVGEIGLFDFHRAGEAMAQGAKAALKQIEDIRAMVRAHAA